MKRAAPPSSNPSSRWRPDARWGTPPWTVGVRVPRTPLRQRVDVAVVGAGLTGLSAARVLASRGVCVAVLEASRVGAGASGRTGGIALEDAASGPLAGVEDCLPALERLVRESGIECELRLDGCWELTHGRPEAGGPIRWRDGDGILTVAETVPGGTLDPGTLLSGLALAALEAGATVHEETPVRHIATGAERLLDLGHRRLGCDHVVLALNAYTDELFPGAARLHSALTLAVCTAPLGGEVLASLGLVERKPFYTQDLPFLWGRVISDGRLVFGSGLAFAPSGSPRELDVARDEAAASLASLEARVRGLHPALATVRIESRWGGPVALRSGAIPLVGRHASDPRVILTGAYAGHGVSMSLRVGALAASAILDGEPLPPWGSPDGDTGSAASAASGAGGRDAAP